MTGAGGVIGERVVIDDGETGSSVSYVPAYIDTDQCERITAEVDVHAKHFEGGTMFVGEQRVKTPRLVAAFGDAPYAYRDMGASHPWPPTIGGLRGALERDADHPFNYALVNWYRDGADFTGWHADKIEMHVPGSTIAILSLGAVRTLAFRRIGGHAVSHELRLEPGSLVWMRGTTQLHYEHAIPAEPGLRERRLSLTFRHILETAAQSRH